MANLQSKFYNIWICCPVYIGHYLFFMWGLQQPEWGIDQTIYEADGNFTVSGG